MDIYSIRLANENDAEGNRPFVTTIPMPKEYGQVPSARGGRYEFNSESVQKLSPPYHGKVTTNATPTIVRSELADSYLPNLTAPALLGNTLVLVRFTLPGAIKLPRKLNGTGVFVKAWVCLFVAMWTVVPAFACDKDKAIDVWVAKKSMQMWVQSGGNVSYEKATLTACTAITKKPKGYYSAADSCVDAEGTKINSKETLESCEYFISLGKR